MGVVYRAEDLRLRRPVAIKVLASAFLGSEERRLRFVREARAAAAVSHPNIATIYEVGDESGVLFIAMEHLEGTTLRPRITGKPLPAKEVLQIGIGVTEGLARAHAAGVIHRDLKPENVFLTNDRQVKVLDFGLAKLRERAAETPEAPASHIETISIEMTREGKVVGTAAYMAPEQARGDVVDARSDLFSLGILMYELVTGVRPFRGRTTTDTLTAILRDDPIPPTQINAELSPDLERIIQKCLAKDPEERYQHAEEVAVDLRRLRRSIDSGMRPIGLFPRRAGAASVLGNRLIRSRSGRLGLVGLLAAVLVTGGVTLWRARYASGYFRAGDRIIVADFENATGLQQFDTSVRDAFENMLSLSALLHVVRGSGLDEILRVRGPGGATGVSREVANRVCAGGGCEGFVVGRIERRRQGYQLEAALYRVGRVRPLVSRSEVAPSDGDILTIVHRVALDIRRSVGESPQALSAVTPPTTRSLQAYQAYSTALAIDDPHERIALLRKAIQLDPDFVGAYSEVAVQSFNAGRCLEYRKFAHEASRRSSSLPEREKALNEINYLDATYDFDTEIEHLRRYQHLYPLDATGPNFLSGLYRDRGDFVSAETHARAAYNLSASSQNLENLADLLFLMGQTDEIERLVHDFRAKGGSEDRATAVLLYAHRLRGDRERIEQSIRLLERRPGEQRAGATARRVKEYLVGGQLTKARDALAPAWRAAQESNHPNWQFAVGRWQLWLDAREGAKKFSLSPQEIEPAKSCLRLLPEIAELQVDLGSEGPLPDLIESHESSERGSTSRFVREEIQFARGCLTLIRGDAATALRSLEPLARNSLLVRRHRVLGRNYEALKQWDRAAKEYEEALRNPNLKYGFHNPALWVLDQFRLAQIYDRLGNPVRARHWYERFLANWKEADPGIPEFAEAKQRLSALGVVGAEAPR